MTATNDSPSDRDGRQSARDGQLGEVAGRADAGKRIVHTMDPDFFIGIGRVSAFGAKKYHMRNFLMAPGMAWGRVYDSAMGHLCAYWGGEELDEESGLPHLLMAAWNIMVLYTYSRHAVYKPGDDRPANVEWAGESWKDWNAAFEAAREPLPPSPPKYEFKRTTDLSNVPEGWFKDLPPAADFNGVEMPYSHTVDRVEGILNHCTANGKQDARLCLADIQNLLNAAKRGLDQ